MHIARSCVQEAETLDRHALAEQIATAAAPTSVISLANDETASFSH